MRPFILWLLLVSFAVGQDAPKPDPCRSIVCIKVPNGHDRDPDGNILRVASMTGCGAIIKVDAANKCPDKGFESWVLATVLTAWHVVDGKPPYNAVLRGGELTTLNVTKRGKGLMDDIAVAICYVPPGYEPLPVVEDHTEYIDNVVAMGIAGKVSKWPTDAHRIDGKRIGRDWLDGRAYYDLIVAPGDSGGPILADGKIVGVVQGGLMAHMLDKENYSKCWPLVSVTPSRLREIVK